MRIIICDDKAEERERCRLLLETLSQKHGVMLEISEYETATSLLFDAEDAGFYADLIFMDIHMPNMNGDEASVRLRDNGYINDIVFLTVSKEYFRNAFDVGALHYVVKGETTNEEFEKIFLRALNSHAEKNQKYVSYCGGGETRNIPLSAIRYYETQRGIVTVHYDAENSFDFPQERLQEIENDLSEYGFFRNHRSFIVSLSKIESVTYNEITMRDGKKLPLSRKKYSELKEILRYGREKAVKV